MNPFVRGREVAWPRQNAVYGSPLPVGLSARYEKGDRMRKLKYWEAISESTVQCMDEDPSICIAGIGVDDFKGLFGTTLEAAQCQ